MLDKHAYASKPNYAGDISNRLIESPIDIDVRGLGKELAKGKAFVPGYFIKKDGTIQRKREYWHSQEVVALDFDNGMNLDEAINEFSDTAAFMYTTFSHTEEKHKFRVVFVLDRLVYVADEIEQIITGLMSKYPQADVQCKDCTRLFYGGKELIELNYDNRLGVSSFLKTDMKKIDNEEIIQSTKKQRKKSNGYKVNSNIAENIQLIKQKNIGKLHEIINPEPQIMHNNYEIFDYLKKRDLRLYLGIHTDKNFIDIFHEENNPSASIYESNKNNGHQLYKCFSDSYSFTGTILEITEKLLNCSILEAKRFLMELYKIELHESDMQKELKAVIDTYKEFLQSEDLEEMYPNFYKVFSNHGYLKDMYILLDLVKEYLPSGDDPRLLFYHSIETIAKKFGRSKSVTHTRMNLFTFFNLLSKLNVEEVPKQLLDIQQSIRKKKGYKYLNSTYEMHLYSYDFFKEIDSKCKMWLQKKCTTKTINYEGIMRNFGIEEANRVFPQDKGKEISTLSEDVVSMMHKTVLENIKQKGWTSEREVLDSVKLYFKGQQNFKEKQFKICLGEMLNAYHLECIRLNKEIKGEMNIGGNGYGYIIREKV
ncbi:hypothetical protein GCM10007140_27360 [Priestia taiwanensis]|uniref:Replication protein n=2 Tax=Priestia taiwanensis TaxID=1347902 RepID=A0A917AUU4_9BACI|nr:hypothetical protein GCM10007140_27360 [Priestia taiwanensis]